MKKSSPNPMPLRTRLQVALTLFGAAAVTLGAARAGSHNWLHFAPLLAVTVLSSGLLVKLPKSDGSMSVNFPFILMGLMVLSPLQALLLAGLSVAAQSRFRVRTIFAATQIAFNIANAMLATACAYVTYASTHRGLASAPALTLASVAYFLWNTGTFAAIIAPSKGEPIYRLWLAEFPWYLPFYLLGATLAALTTWLGEHFGWPTAVMLIPAIYGLYRAYMGQLTRVRERQNRLKETEALHMRIIEGLAMAIEAKDQNTHEHLFRVRRLVEAVGHALALNPLEMKALQTASFLHDIGKLAIPEHIINKPGKLTAGEFEKMKIHPSVGAEILERVRFPYPVVPIVRSHHEWWNGAGYPDGLQGEAIPLGARILTVVDCFDALVSDRAYRKGMTDEQALDILSSLAGKQFDPEIVELFKQCYAALKLGVPELTADDSFIPLNTDVDVWRGLAPGAGFEAGSDENAPAHVPATGTDSDAQVALLLRTASAREAAQSFFELTQSSDLSLALDDCVRIFAMRLQKLLPYDTCVLYQREGEQLRAVASVGDAANLFSPAPMALGTGISGWVAQRVKPLLNGNPAAEPGCPLLRDGTPMFHSALSYPLSDAHGNLLAVLTLYARAGDHFHKDDLRILHAMSSKLALAFGNALASAPMPPEPDLDFLTGMPTARRFFLQIGEELEQCRRNGTGLTVTCCHLNGFVELKQRRGSFASHRLLGALAEDFRRSTKFPDVVARLGPGEFAFLASAPSAAATGGGAAQRTGEILDACRRILGGSVAPASVGTASFPHDGITAETLLATATRRAHLDAQKQQANPQFKHREQAKVAALTA